MKNETTTQQAGDVTSEPDVLAAFVLHFFLNRRLVQDASEVLEDKDLARLHHRILFFARHAPGLTVGDLTRLIGVTHQNVRIPMKQMIEKGLLELNIATDDRRQRRVFASRRGQRLVDLVHSHQTKRLRRAFEQADPDDLAAFLRVHRLIVEEADRQFVDGLRESDRSVHTPRA